MREGSAPTHTRLRTHSSMAARPIQYGSAASPVARPFAMATPFFDVATGCTTAASPGAPCSPTSGLITLPPCTSWSYWRMIQALLAMLGCDNNAFSVSVNPFEGAVDVGATGPCSAAHAGSHTASRVGMGMASSRNSVEMRPISVPCHSSTRSRVGVPKVPSSHISTPCSLASARNAAMRAGDTASTMRSCASLIHTSVGVRPAYFSGARSRCTVAPSMRPISPTALENPPAPQSVTPLNSGPPSASRAASSASSVFFCVIAAPICTA